MAALGLIFGMFSLTFLVLLPGDHFTNLGALWGAVSITMIVVSVLSLVGVI